MKCDGDAAVHEFTAPRQGQHEVYLPLASLDFLALYAGVKQQVKVEFVTVTRHCVDPGEVCSGVRVEKGRKGWKKRCFYFHLTESQNVRGWKGPGKLIQCNPPMEQEHPDEVTQEGVQAGWNVCTEGDSTTPWAAWARL